MIIELDQVNPFSAVGLPYSLHCPWCACVSRDNPEMHPSMTAESYIRCLGCHNPYRIADGVWMAKVVMTKAPLLP